MKFRLLLYTILSASNITIPAFSNSITQVAEYIHQGDTLMQASRDTLDTSVYASAEQAYMNALEIDSQSVEAMVGLAWVHNSEHEFEAGKTWATKAISLDPRNDQAYSLLGDAFLEEGDYQLAELNYQTALSIRPSLSTYSRAGFFLWTIGEVEKGKSLMKMAIEVGSPHAENLAWCQAQLAKMHFDSGNVSEAISLSNAAIKTAPDNPIALSIGGEIQRSIGNKDRAVSLLQHSLAINPSHQAYSNLYDLQLEQGNVNKAHQTYHALLSYHDQHSHHHGHSHSIDSAHHETSHGDAELALFWADRDLDLNEAHRQAARAYQHYPNLYSGEALAWTHYQIGAFADAKKIIDSVLETGTKQPILWMRAGLIYNELGKTDEAVRYIEKAIKTNPYLNSPYKDEALALLESAEIAVLD